MKNENQKNTAPKQGEGDKNQDKRSERMTTSQSSTLYYSEGFATLS